MIRAILLLVVIITWMPAAANAGQKVAKKFTEGHWLRAYSTGVTFNRQITVSIECKDLEKTLERVKGLMSRDGAKEIAQNVSHIRSQSQGKTAGLSFEVSNEKADKLAREVLDYGTITNYNNYQQFNMQRFDEIKDSLEALEDEVGKNEEVLKSMPIANAMLTSKLKQLKAAKDSHEAAMDIARINVTLVEKVVKND